MRPVHIGIHESILLHKGKDGNQDKCVTSKVLTISIDVTGVNDPHQFFVADGKMTVSNCLGVVTFNIVSEQVSTIPPVYLIVDVLDGGDLRTVVFEIQHLLQRFLNVFGIRSINRTPMIIFDFVGICAVLWVGSCGV